MAVAIRLQRIGKPHQPYYRVVAIDKRRGAHGKPLEILGSYDPSKEKKEEKVRLKSERVQYWIKNGAKPSETVAYLIKAAK
jgi:small subunit ribosomal protein S16